METFDYYFSIVKNSRSYSVWVLAEKLGPRWVGSVRIVSPSGNDVAYTDFSRSSLDNTIAESLGNSLFNSSVVDQVTTGTIVTANGQTAYTIYQIYPVVAGTYYHEASAYADSARTQRICILVDSVASTSNTHLSSQLKDKVEAASAIEDTTLITEITHYKMEYKIIGRWVSYFGFNWNLTLSVVCKNNNIELESMTRTATSDELKNSEAINSNYFYSVIGKYLQFSTVQVGSTVYYTTHRIIPRSDGTYNHCVALDRNRARTTPFAVTNDLSKSTSLLGEMDEAIVIVVYNEWYTAKYERDGKYYYMMLIPQYRLNDLVTYTVQLKCLSNTLSFPDKEIKSDTNSDSGFMDLKSYLFNEAMDACTETRTFVIGDVWYRAICRTMLKGIENGSPVYAKWGAVFHPEYSTVKCKLDPSVATFHGEILSGTTSNDKVFSDLLVILNSVV